MSEVSLAERVESLKAGLIGAAGSTSAALAWAVGVQGLQAVQAAPAEGLRAGLGAIAAVGWTLPGLAHGAIALLSGFLFGVTYRYVVRQDANPHLKSGAVMAFGLVRGLAEIDQIWPTLQPQWSAILPLLESVLIFAIARALLDAGLARGWVRPFGLLAQVSEPSAAVGSTNTQKPTAEIRSSVSKS